MRKAIPAILAALMIFSATAVFGQSERRVRFARGATQTTVSGSIRGYAYIDYLVGIRDGQVLTLKLTGSSSAEMVLFDPDGENVPDAAGIREIVTRIDRSGDYKVRVVMPRAMARRGTTARFSLFVKVEDMR